MIKEQNTIITIFTNIDKRLLSNITGLLDKYYFPSQGMVFSEQNMITLFKITSYSMFLLLPFAVLKIVKPDNSLVTLLFVISLIAFTSSLFGLFLGFFQLLFV